MQTHQTRGLVKGFVTKRLCLKREPSTQYALAFVQGYHVREREKGKRFSFKTGNPKVFQENGAQLQQLVCPPLTNCDNVGNILNIQVLSEFNLKQ